MRLVYRGGGEAALYFDPKKPKDIAKAIERLTTEPETMGDLVNRGRARARNFAEAKPNGRAISPRCSRRRPNVCASRENRRQVNRAVSKATVQTLLI